MGCATPRRRSTRPSLSSRSADRSADRTARLSKGLKQRVALARAIVHRPSIVLLDEPTAGLDPESARDVRELIVAMRGEGRAVLLCTHNLDEVERVADRVAVLRSRLVAIGTPRENSGNGCSLHACAFE